MPQPPNCKARTGITSAEVAWRVVNQHGSADVVLLTADTRREYEDNWRFAREVADRLGCEWVRLADGRTPMEAGRDQRCVPSNQMAVCSRILKRELLDRYRDARFDPAGCIVYLGYDWTEPHRLEAARRHWAPWTVDCPLTRPPYLWKQELLTCSASAVSTLRGCIPMVSLTPTAEERASVAARRGGACCSRSTAPGTCSGRRKRRKRRKAAVTSART